MLKNEIGEMVVDGIKKEKKIVKEEEEEEEEQIIIVRNQNGKEIRNVKLWIA